MPILSIVVLVIKKLLAESKLFYIFSIIMMSSVSNLIGAA